MTPAETGFCKQFGSWNLTPAEQIRTGIGLEKTEYEMVSVDAEFRHLNLLQNPSVTAKRNAR